MSQSTQPAPGADSSQSKPSVEDGGTTATTQDETAEKGFKTATIPLKRFWFLTLGICLGLFLGMVDTSIVATSIYSIGVDFKTADQVNWVALAYTLAYVGCAVTFARLSDIIGRRNAFLLAYTIFFGFSLACGFAKNMKQIIAFRVFQGMGGSGLTSLALVMLPEMSPTNLLQFIGAIVGLVIAISGVLGPVLGGILTHYADWRWVFWINGPIGFVSIIIFFIAWPKKEFLPTYEVRSWSSFDIIGTLLTVAAPTLIVFSFQHAGESIDTIWDKGQFLAPLLFGIACFVALFIWERFLTKRSGERFSLAFPIHLFNNRHYAAGALSAMFLGFPYFVVVFSFPLRAQVVSGKDALLAGVMLLPMLGSTAIGTLSAGKMNSKNNYLFETMLIGAFLLMLGTGLLSTVKTSGDDHKALGFLVFCGLGFGIATTAASMIANVEAPIRETAPAQGIISQLRLLGGSLGISTSTVFIKQETKKHLVGLLSPVQLQTLGRTGPPLTQQQLEALALTYSNAFRHGMFVAAGVAGAGALVTFLAFRRTRVSFQEQRQQRVLDEKERWAARMASDSSEPASA